MSVLKSFGNHSLRRHNMPVEFMPARSKQCLALSSKIIFVQGCHKLTDVMCGYCRHGDVDVMNAEPHFYAELFEDSSPAPLES
eukprot:scaffold155168_cov18-Prasinocladus_malaysianus.AAC.1